MQLDLTTCQEEGGDGLLTSAGRGSELLRSPVPPAESAETPSGGTSVIALLRFKLKIA